MLEVILAGGAVGEPGARKGHIPRNCFSLSLDSDQKDQLIEVIEKLLADKTTVGTSWEERTSGGKGTDRCWFKFLCPSHSHPLSCLASPAGGWQCSDGL